MSRCSYSVGIYARLSVDSDERKNESIETQIAIAKAYIAGREDMVLSGCYTDIGKTGTNFKREGFERMMRDVRMRKIDCIVVKDLSRFGRNHIETGNYLEKIFPFMGVRFIAVTDHFDSADISGRNETLGVNLKNLVNEMYARDIAVKVKSSRQTKWEQGSFTGGVPPYGYRAEQAGGKNKRGLFAEEATSDIVKKIYELFLAGRSLKQIALWLYEERIVRPAEYHRTGQIYCPAGETLREWSRGTIRMILTNPVYTGCLVRGGIGGKDCRPQGRCGIVSGDRAVREHTHEPLVSEEMFSAAAGRLEKTSGACKQKGCSGAAPPDADLFAAVLFCGDCGAKMKRISAIKELRSKAKVRRYRYNCPMADRIDGEKCVTKSIGLQTLSNFVKAAIQQEFALSAMQINALVEKNHREAERMKGEWRQELLRLGRRMENTKRLGSEQYLRYREGEMDAESFRSLKEENAGKILAFRKRCADISEKLKAIDEETERKNQFLRAVVEGGEGAELTAEAVNTLISRIEVYRDHRIRIVFRFGRRGLSEKVSDCDLYPGIEGG